MQNKCMGGAWSSNRPLLEHPDVPTGACWKGMLSNRGLLEGRALQQAPVGRTCSPTGPCWSIRVLQQGPVAKRWRPILVPDVFEMNLKCVQVFSRCGLGCDLMGIYIYIYIYGTPLLLETTSEPKSVPELLVFLLMLLRSETTSEPKSVPELIVFLLFLRLETTNEPKSVPDLIVFLLMLRLETTSEPKSVPDFLCFC